MCVQIIIVDWKGEEIFFVGGFNACGLNLLWNNELGFEKCPKKLLYWSANCSTPPWGGGGPPTPLLRRKSCYAVVIKISGNPPPLR